MRELLRLTRRALRRRFMQSKLVVLVQKNGLARVYDKRKLVYRGRLQRFNEIIGRTKE